MFVCQILIATISGVKKSLLQLWSSFVTGLWERGNLVTSAVLLPLVGGDWILYKSQVLTHSGLISTLG